MRSDTHRLREQNAPVTARSSTGAASYARHARHACKTIPMRARAHARIRAAITDPMCTLLEVQNLPVSCVSPVTSHSWRGFRFFLPVTAPVSCVSEMKRMGPVKKRSMRDEMPQVAKWIDELREEFGADQVDASIRAGMRGEPNRFRATENGHELGTPFEATRRIVPCE